MSAAEPQPLAWDSAWLGFPVARLAPGPACPAADVAAAIARSRAAGTRLLYLLCGPGDAAAALAAGGALADVRLTYELLLPAPGPVLPPPAGIRVTRARELTADLELLAWQSGAHSRFRRDARIGQHAFEALYTHWLRRVLDEGTVWSAADEDHTVGLLAFAEGRDHAHIELVAVAPAARRRHVAQHLVQIAAQEAVRRGHPVLQVVTQGTNQPACRLYEAAGFRLLRTEHVYHLWL